MGNLSNLLGYLILPLTIVVSGVAIWGGRGAERYGGIALAVNLVTQLSAVAVLRKMGYRMADFAVYLDIPISFMLALCFMVAALKFSSRWLGFAFIIQGAELAVSSYFIGEASLKNYLLILNVMTLLVLGLLAIATAISLIRRHRFGPYSDFEIHGVNIINRRRLALA